MRGTRPLSITVEDGCFCHWPVDADALDRTLPSWLTAETVDGDAWVSAIAHTVRRVSAFGFDVTTPAEWLPVRTPVRGPTGQRGVHFFAVFVSDEAVGTLAKHSLRLPYRAGRLERTTDDEYRTRRTLTIDGERALSLRHTPDDGEPSTAPPDSLAGFLVERRRYFTTGALGTRLVGSVGHDGWPLSRGESAVGGSLLSALGLPEPVGEPLVHYSPGTALGLAPPRPLWLD